MFESLTGVLLSDVRAGSSREKNAVVHDGLILCRKDDLHEDTTELKFKAPPKLVIVSIDSDKDMLKSSTDDDNYAVQRVVDKIILALHPQGTVAFGVPRPWLMHGGRIYGEASFDVER